MSTDNLSTPPTSDVARLVVRHLAATLAYRASKVIRGVPAGFWTTSFGETTRQPVRIVGHMADLMAWGVTMAQGEAVWKAESGDDWEAEVTRFFDGLEAIEKILAADAPFTGSIEQLIQGPFADALTHVGQLAMLRGMAGAPVTPESYARAAIMRGRVGLDQPPPGREFKGDASVKRK